MLPQLTTLLALSGAAALTCEMVWLRRLTLATGSAGVATTLILALYMAGLGLGGVWAGRRTWHRAPGEYGVLELLAAGWAVLFPTLLAVIAPRTLPIEGLTGHLLLAAALLLPPALLHGATLPAVCAAVTTQRQTAGLYAINTAGAVLGTLAAAFVWMPLLGVRGTELVAASCSGLAGLGALLLARQQRWTDHVPQPPTGGVPGRVLLAAAVAGGGAMALEASWSRLAALLLGGSVYAMAIVLAVFLAGVALGAELGRRWGAAALAPALAALGLLAVCGTAAWRALPHGLALAWSLTGPSGQLASGAVLLAVAMAGAPVASGVVFSACLQSAPGCTPQRAAGQVLGANTLGGVLGAAGAGLVLMPALGIRGVVLLVATLAVLTAAILPGSRRARLAPVLALTLLSALTPRWDPALYAVGLYNRLGEFVDLSPRAIETFAHDGWTMRYYRDGITASVAVGESTRTGNRWLSINGKVDASTGADMPTQQLSGQLPLAVAGPGDRPTLVVGLASGVTAGEALASGADPLTVIELEPSVVTASRLFDHVSGAVLDDHRVTLIEGDARAHLLRPGPDYAVIISEPSNPWITGVSNLFTLQYWQIARSRLRPDGVFCQWVQLYALPPRALRSLVRTFLTVFPQAWLFETIPGADALLIAAPALPDGLPIQPTLGPEQLHRLAGRAPINTDDRPWIEFEAPKWLNRPTGALNRELLGEAQRP